MSTLIIVESPTKAKTISKFLSKDFIVKSSMGHIRDLPKKEMGIDIEHNFIPKYEVPEKSLKTIRELKSASKKATEIILATDEDREGEAIAWHLMHALELDPKKTKRIVFHEITKSAIQNALATPRSIDQDLVNAQQARRILDRLVGYELSPFLWKKIKYGLSAGRVQSVAVRLICEREDEIRKFTPQEYWSIVGEFIKQGTKDEKDIFESKLIKINEKKLDKFDIENEKQATEIVADLKTKTFLIQSIKKKKTQKKPPTPFITSTLQQDASNKLGFAAKKTMMIAQQLYEGIKIGSEGEVGLISYMRTDSMNLSTEVLKKIRKYVETNFGKTYLPDSAQKYKTKSKGAQEAHEAIRPTFPEKSPEEIKSHLSNDQFKLYDLIWRRTIACQMNPAIMDSTSIDIQGDQYILRTTGSIIQFDGFLKVYKTSTKETFLPELQENDALENIKITPNQHFTEPPARYSEASLIKTLEENGIGRPSTYAPTISTVQDRNYVLKNNDKKFEPTDTGELVNKVLVEHFQQIVDIDFTAKMEEDLDKIAEQQKEWQPILENFYTPFKSNLVKKDQELTKKELTEEETDEKCDKCQSAMIIKMGRYGKFMACSNYPECKNTKPIKSDKDDSETKESAEPEKTGEKCDKCQSDMIIKVGRFGKFMACSNYPDCKNTKPITTGIKCPKCEKGEIAEKKSKRGKNFYSCTKYPDCDFAIWTKPTGDKCPDCKSLLVYGAKNTIRCSSKECKYKTDAPEKED